MTGFVLRAIRLGQCAWLTAILRHLQQTAPCVGEHDRSAGAPRRAEQERRAADGDRRCAIESYLLQFAEGSILKGTLPEREPLPVWREERAVGVLRASNRRGLLAIERPRVELLLPAFDSAE